VKGATTDKRQVDEFVAVPHTPSVGIQELREAERAFHQGEGSRQRRIYAVATRKITPPSSHRTTSRNRERRLRSPSRTR